MPLATGLVSGKALAAHEFSYHDPANRDAKSIPPWRPNTVAKKRSKKPASDKPTFEDALEQLEQIVHALEEGDVGLDESLAQYERGVRLLRQCHELLEGAQRRVELIQRVDAEGRPTSEPMDDDPTISPGKKTRSPSKPGPASELAPPFEEGSSGQGGMDVPGGLF